MGSTAGFGVNTFDIDDAEGVARDDTTLVQRETVFALSLGLIHKAFRDVMTIIDQPVSSILNVLLLLASQTLIVRDIKMSFPLGLLCTGLPDVRSKDLAARGENKMCSSMVSLQLETSFSINGSVNSSSNGLEVVGDLPVKFVKDTFTDLDAIDNVEDLIDAIDAKCSNVVGLASRCWIEATLIKDHQVSLVLFLDVCENSDALGGEVHRAIVIEVDTSCLGQVDRIVQNCLWFLHDLLLSCGDFVVEVAWCGCACDFGDRVDGDAPGSHGEDPIVHLQIVLPLLEKLFELNGLGLISVQPSVVLDLDNFPEALVLWELAVDSS